MIAKALQEIRWSRVRI